MKLHIVIHESFEAPGAIEAWAQKKGHDISYTRLYEGDGFPHDVDGFDFLIVMGGPQSPATTQAECPHFNAQKEIAFIGDAIRREKLALGVCLGAQLIGEALGAKFDHSPNREIGVFEVSLTEESKEDPIFSKFPETFLVGHWHGDMPGLTTDSQILAMSKGCPRQIVRYTPKVYGFQCHFEFTPACIGGMIQNATHELEEYKTLPYVEDARALRSHDYTEMNKLLFMFLDSLTSR